LDLLLGYGIKNLNRIDIGKAVGCTAAAADASGFVVFFNHVFPLAEKAVPVAVGA
jgi:hypothetical protein